MNKLSLESFLKLINKYGATAVLAAWLFMNNIRINKLENQLYDCYRERVSTNLQPCSNRPDRIHIRHLVAVLPEKQKTICTHQQEA